MPTPSAIDGGKTRPIVVKTMMAGGLRRNDVLLLTTSGAERLSPAQLAQQQLARTSSPPAGSGPCLNF